MEEASDTPIDFFVSRAGPDAESGKHVANILENAGKRVIIQDWDFKNRSFMERMHTALASGARVVALLSPDYLIRDHCSAEWQNAIADDPLNRRSRLIVLRVRPCEPVGLLKSLAYCDLVPLLAHPATSGDMLRDVVLAAVEPGRDKRPPGDLSKLFYKPQPILHAEVKPTPSFTGRGDELRAIGDALSRGATAAITQAAAVHGLGGIGKSTLAREHAWRGREGYAGIWWLSAEKAKESDAWDGIEQGLVALRGLLYPGAGEPKERAKAAREMLSLLSALGSEKPWLLVYDNVDDARALEAWPSPSNVRVLVTSRLRSWRVGVVGIDVAPWPLAEAARYLQSDSRRADLSESDAERIAKALGRLPLALSHAAAYLRDVDSATPDSYLAAFSEHMRDAPESADYPRAVFATLMENVRQAEARAPGAASVLSLAAFYAPDDIPEELFQQAAEHYPPGLAAVVGKPVALEQAIGALAGLSLVEFRRETRTFSVHRLVQEAVRDWLGRDQTTWAESAVQAVNAASPGPDFRHWPAFERLQPHARAAAALAGDELGPPLALLLNQTGYYLHERASYAEAEPLYRRSLSIREKALGPDHPDVGTSLNNLAVLYEDQGEYDLAEPLYKRSLSISEKALGRDHPSVGVSLNNLAGLYKAQGRYELGEPLYKRSLSIREKALGRDHPSVGTSLNNLAGLYRAQGKYELAEPLYKRDLEISEKALGPDHPNTAITAGNIAYLYACTGRLNEAGSLARRAHGIFAKVLGDAHPNTQGTAKLLEAIDQALRGS